MKKILIILLFLIMSASDLKAQLASQRNLPETGLLDERLDVPVSLIPNYRDVMREIIYDLSLYSKGRDPNFSILAREGLYLLFKGEWEQYLDELHEAQQQGLVYDDEKFIVKMFKNEEDAPYQIGTPIRRYINNIDGVVINGAFCGHNAPDNETSKIIDDAGLVVFGVEHCNSKESKFKAIKDATSKEIALHIDNDMKKKFDKIPRDAIPLVNSENINTLRDVRNLLIMTNSKDYGSRAEWVYALSETNYDMLVIDPFYKGKEALIKGDITALKFKKLGSKRKVIARINLTEAEDFRFYWKKDWRLGNPAWLRMVSKTNPAGIVVEYWNPSWKEIIGILVKGVVDLGFDGIMFDGLDAHLRFEKLTPID